jgi:hypothetical protein
MTVNAEMILCLPEFNMKDVFYEYTPAIFKKQTLNKTFLTKLALIMLSNSVA